MLGCSRQRKLAHSKIVHLAHGEEDDWQASSSSGRWTLAGSGQWAAPRGWTIPEASFGSWAISRGPTLVEEIGA